MMRTPNSLTALIVTALLVSGCGGEKETAPPPGDATPPETATDPEPEIDLSPRQRELFDQTLGLVGRVGDALSSIGDHQSARNAGDQIISINSELQSLAAQMEQAGTPTAELASEFTEQFGQTNETVRNRIGEALTKLELDPYIIRELNRSLDSLEKTLEHPTLRAYGLKK